MVKDFLMGAIVMTIIIWTAHILYLLIMLGERHG